MNWLPDTPWLRTLALAGTAVAVVFLLFVSDEPPVTDDRAAALRGEAEPDGFVVNGDYAAFDEAGNLKVRFVSPRIEQFEDDNLATMTFPRAWLYPDDGTPPWIVEADSGSLLQSQNLMHLTNNVRVERTIGDRQATLTTSTLTLDNNQGMAYTDAPVEIRDLTGITQATGMKAWIDERIVELNSEVEGRYETGN